MGRPIPSKYIGADAGKIRIHFHNGTSVVTGYIVKQMGSSRYQVTADGTTLFIVDLAQDTATAQSLTSGLATIQMTDVSSTTFYVKKLMTYLASFTNGTQSVWGFDPASAGVMAVEENPVVPTSITATPSPVSVVIGATQALTVTVLPAGAPQTVSYVSSVPGTATVNSSGLITGVAAGSANVTITSTANNAITKVVPVTVTVPPATSVTSTPTSVSTTVSGTQQLTVAVQPSGASQSVTYTVANSAIATVSSSGLVTGVATGSTVVTIHASNGVTGTVNVTVA